jgi:hypothetical protein
MTRRLRLGLKIDSQSQFTQLRVKESVTGDWASVVTSAFVDWLEILLNAGNLEGSANKSQVDLVSGSYAETGSDVFLPFDPVEAGEIQTGDATETVLTAASLQSFSGRSANGVARFYLRGLHVVDFTSGYEDFRLSASEQADVANALDDLASTGGLGEYLCASDGEDILFWKPYMNVSVSRRYINHARRA